MKKILILCVLFLVLVLSASFVYIELSYEDETTYYSEETQQETPVIYIQPLGNVDQTYINTVKNSIESFYHFDCEVLETYPLTKDLLAPSKTRYSSMKILEKFNTKFKYLVVTEVDIVVQNGKYPEWGIFGLGYCPGNVCVVSTFRLKRNASFELTNERLKKVSLHELGHNLGVDHCKNNLGCIMNEGDGSLKSVDTELGMCDKCLKKIGF